MPYCPKCGNPLSEESRFCPRCGASVSSSIPQPAPQYQTNYVPSENRAPTNYVPDSIPVRSAVSCHYHDGVPAVSYCARCGKPLCQDCCDSYGVSDGEYEGRVLCYDCTRQLVAENVELLKENKKEIMKTFVLTLIGVVIGGIIGAVAGGQDGFVPGLVGFLFGALIGGCFWTYVTNIFWRTVGAISGGGLIVGLIVGLVFGSIIEGVLAIYRTVRTIVECIIYLKKTQGFIESDSESLRMMDDYMAFTQIRNADPDADIDTLIARNPQLAGNSVAQMARTRTEEQIEADMRGRVSSVSENSEVLHKFAERNDKKNGKK